MFSRDTVNTASRIESTGVKGRIHASESTARILMANGKRDSVIPRQDKVEAKGMCTVEPCIRYCMTNPAHL